MRTEDDEAAIEGLRFRLLNEAGRMGHRLRRESAFRQEPRLVPCEWFDEHRACLAIVLALLL